MKDEGEQAERSSPPAYDTLSHQAFVIDEDDQAYSETTRRPDLVSPKSSPLAPEMVKHREQGSLATFPPQDRFKVPLDPQALEKSRPRGASQHDTVQYWLRPEDSLRGLALRFNVPVSCDQCGDSTILCSDCSGPQIATLCVLNQLPSSVSTTTPNIVHTRRFLLLPASCVPPDDSSNPDDIKLREALGGPPKQSTAEKVKSARRGAEARFRTGVARTSAASGDAVATARANNETPPDDRAARAYVALVEQELAWVDFGDEQQETNVVLSPDEAERHEQLQDAARLARYDAVVTQAIARWMMDSDWERQQRREGLLPSEISHKRATPMAGAGNGLGSLLGSWITGESRKVPTPIVNRMTPTKSH